MIVDWNSKVPLYFQAEPKKSAFLTFLALASIATLTIGLLGHLQTIRGLNFAATTSMMAISSIIILLSARCLYKKSNSHLVYLHQLLNNPQSSEQEICRVLSVVENIDTPVNGQTAIEAAIEKRPGVIEYFPHSDSDHDISLGKKALALPNRNDAILALKGLYEKGISLLELLRQTIDMENAEELIPLIIRASAYNKNGFLWHIQWNPRPFSILLQDKKPQILYVILREVKSIRKNDDLSITFSYLLEHSNAATLDACSSFLKPHEMIAFANHLIKNKPAEEEACIALIKKVFHNQEFQAQDLQKINDEALHISHLALLQVLSPFLKMRVIMVCIDGIVSKDQSKRKSCFEIIKEKIDKKPNLGREYVFRAVEYACRLIREKPDEEENCIAFIKKILDLNQGIDLHSDPYFQNVAKQVQKITSCITRVSSYGILSYFLTFDDVVQFVRSKIALSRFALTSNDVIKRHLYLEAPAWIQIVKEKGQSWATDTDELDSLKSEVSFMNRVKPDLNLDVVYFHCFYDIFPFRVRPVSSMEIEALVKIEITVEAIIGLNSQYKIPQVPMGIIMKYYSFGERLIEDASSSESQVPVVAK